MTEDEIKASVVAYVERQLTAEIYCTVSGAVVKSEDGFVPLSFIQGRSSVSQRKTVTILKTLVEAGHLEIRKGIIEPLYRTTWNPKAPGDPSPETLAMIALVEE